MRARFVLILVLALPCPAAHADQVTLANGDRLTGTVVALENRSLKMSTALAGVVTIGWPAVASLELEQPLAITLPAERVLTGTLALRDDLAIIETPEGETVESPKDEILALRTPAAQARHETQLRPGLLDLWRGSADAGLSSTSGNSDTVTLSLGFNATRQTARDTVSAYLNSLFARDSTDAPTEVTANTVRGGARYERNLGARLLTFGFTDLEFDELQGLDLRTVLGGGVGWRLRESARTVFKVFTGGSFNQEFFENEPTRRSGEALLGEEVSHRLTDFLSLRERFQFFPNLSETGEFRATLDAGAEARLNDWLSWQITLSDRFLSNPPPGTEKNDLLTTTGIRLTFGRPAD
ncbi:MAG: YdiY family protein [Terriglobia bacterium]